MSASDAEELKTDKHARVHEEGEIRHGGEGKAPFLHEKRRDPVGYAPVAGQIAETHQGSQNRGLKQLSLEDRAYPDAFSFRASGGACPLPPVRRDEPGNGEDQQDRAGPGEKKDAPVEAEHEPAHEGREHRADGETAVNERGGPCAKSGRPVLGDQGGAGPPETADGETGKEPEHHPLGPGRDQQDQTHADTEPREGQKQRKAPAPVFRDEAEYHRAGNGPDHRRRSEEAPFGQGDAEDLEQDGHGDGEDDQVVAVHQVGKKGGPQHAPPVRGPGCGCIRTAYTLAHPSSPPGQSSLADEAERLCSIEK